MILRKRSATHDRRRHRNVRALSKFAQFIGSVATDDSAAAIKDGALRFFDEPDDLVQLNVTRSAIRLIAAQANLLREKWLRARLLNILRDINHHRTRPASLRDVKRFFDHA